MGKLSLTMVGVLGGGGASALGGYSIYSMMQPKTINEKLLREGFQLISDIKETTKLDQAWNKTLDRYKVEADNDSRINSKDHQSLTKDEIVQWCKDNLGKKIDNNLYSKASKWCVTFTSISEKLSRDSKKLKEDVSSLKTKYNSIPSNLQAEINKITASEGDNKTGEQTKAWCSSLSKRAFLNEEDGHYQHIINYCI
ncbi:hypothetical protein HF1_04500 [Mycoplasma haemofelis str. Langford 1]|uniref:Uncharacterized protein n=1 Tax=Mycoplasma haemofelis (strain Langford 1) TaxID=941640 RepID=E8ZH37_MYCHL|nr:hypothetical protein [Mycoplasma haemofelis]CBY92458.1 hypothetical protein HF1_04500 [Mycoplasma haemofelis str. Langford 1]